MEADWATPRLTLRACESFGRWLHTYLTLRNGAKQSVTKGGNTHGAYASLERGSLVLRVPILRDRHERKMHTLSAACFGLQSMMEMGIEEPVPYFIDIAAERAF